MKTRTKFFLSLAAGALSLLGVGGTAHAQSRDSCNNTLNHDQREVDRAADRYGYDSPQAQHERAEMQRDAANCGYTNRDNNASYQSYQGDRDRDDSRYRSYDNYRDYDRRQDRYDPAFDNGYRDGVNIGQQDARRGKGFRPQKHDEYEDADHGYNRSYGEKNQYKNMYRQGFQTGYSDGFGRGR